MRSAREPDAAAAELSALSGASPLALACVWSMHKSRAAGASSQPWRTARATEIGMDIEFFQTLQLQRHVSSQTEQYVPTHNDQRCCQTSVHPARYRDAVRVYLALAAFELETTRPQPTCA